MGCVHRKRIREVTNPDWNIIEEASEFTSEQWLDLQYILDRRKRGLDR